MPNTKTNKKVTLLIAFLLSAFYLFAQDIIVRTNGVSVNCKIDKIDSSTIYYSIYRGGRAVPASIDRKLVSDVQYGNMMPGKKRDSIAFNQSLRNCLTIGILEGGGALVGLDYEVLLSPKFGIQIGGGIVGFGAGLDIHFIPDIRSSFLTLQYWHQGVGNSYTQSLLGPSFVFRGKKWFTAQFGFGFALEKGPAWPKTTKQPSMMLTYAIGGYIPW